jgi:hypothetical protein
MQSIFTVAFQWSVVRRSLMLAVIVGAILIAINHGTCILSGQFGTTCLWQSVLTLVVPYCVSTVSFVMAHFDRAA